MKETATIQKDRTAEKPGLFKRIVSKVDAAMKQKAEAKAQENSCCGGKDGKGGKCC